MTIVYLWALLAIALSLCVLMAFAWVVRERTGNSGWVDTIWTFAVGLVGAGSALWPVGRGSQYQAMAGGSAGRDLVAAARAPHRDPNAADIRRPALCRVCEEWGANASRRMFVFLQNQ